MTPAPDALAIRQDNVLLIGPFPEGQPLEHPHTPGAIADAFRRCNIALLIAWPGVRTPYPRLARLLHAHDIAFTLVLCHPPEAEGSAAVAAFFPVEDPSPCWRCLELRWLGWSDDVPRTLAWLESLQFPDLIKPSSTSFPSEEARVLLSWAAMDVLGADAGEARLVLEDGAFSVHSFLPHPQCAWCSPWAGVKPSSTATHLGLPSLFDDRMGLFRRTEGAVLPSSLAVRPPEAPDPVLLSAARGETMPPHVLRLAHPAPYLADGPAHHTLACGGSDEVPAALILDAMAAYATALRAGRAVWRGTRRGVALPAPDPTCWMSPVVAPAEGERSYAPSLELDWLRAHDLHTGDVVGIPADLVYSGAPRDGLPRGDSAASTAHTSLNVSVRWALSRVAENDALMAAWYTHLPPVRIPPENLAPHWREAIEEARAQGLTLEVLDLTTDLGIPVLALVGHHDSRWFHGCGASWQPERALRAAWARAGQAYLRALPVPDDIDFLFEGPVGPWPDTVHGGVTDPIDTWRMMLARRRLRGLWVDITSPDVAHAGGIVTRAWVTDTLPMPPVDAPLLTDPETLRSIPAGVRLLELPLRTGLRDAALAPEALHLRPHPFT